MADFVNLVREAERPTLKERVKTTYARASTAIRKARPKVVEAAQDVQYYVDSVPTPRRPGRLPPNYQASQPNPQSRDLLEFEPKQHGRGVLNIGGGTFGLSNSGGYDLNSPRGFGLDTNQGFTLSNDRPGPSLRSESRFGLNSTRSKKQHPFRLGRD